MLKWHNSIIISGPLVVRRVKDGQTEARKVCSTSS